MSALVDPTLCPDCRRPLDATSTCTGCGLRLRGPLAQELWTTMVHADTLVRRLRELAPVAGGMTADRGSRAASAAPVALDQHPPVVPVGIPTSSGGPSDPGLRGGPDAAAVGPRRRRLPSSSVPVVLLGLGGVCLLVAVVVFAAVTWSLLGLTGRTVVLLGLTGLVAGAATVPVRRSLPVAAEVLWLVVSGMVVVDVLAAWSAGLAGLDALGGRVATSLLGLVLLALGTGVALWVRQLPLGRLYGVQGVAVLGTFLVWVAQVQGADVPAVAATISLPLLAGLALVLRRTLPPVAVGASVLGVLSWLTLVATGVDRAALTVSTAGWWTSASGWPLLVAALVAGVGVHAPGVRPPLRPLLAALALAPLAAFLLVPDLARPTTYTVVTGSLVLAALAALASVTHGTTGTTRTTARLLPWSRGAAGLGGLGGTVALLVVLVRPWSVLVPLLDAGSRTPGAVVPGSVAAFQPAAWTAPLLALAVVTTLVTVVRHVPHSWRVTGPRAADASAPASPAPASPAPASFAPASLAPGVLGTGLLSLVLELGPVLWLATSAGVVVAAGAGLGAWRVRTSPGGGLAGSLLTAYLVVLAYATAAPSALLCALVSTVLLLGVGAAYGLREREGSGTSAAVLGALAVLAAGLTVLTWTLQAGLGAGTRSVLIAVLAAAAALGATLLSRSTPSRLALEGAAAAVGLAAVASTSDGAVTAVVLTVLGSATCAQAVLHADRRVWSWVGTVVLAAALVLRVQQDVRAPELSTLPAALLLVVAGALRLLADREASSVTMLGSGLTLGVVPSLLLSLDEPVSLRGALVAVAVVALLAVGVTRHLGAPFAVGALGVGLLALRHLGPVAEAVPRWISLGLLGAALLVVGVSWESRRRDLHAARRYLTALR